MADIAGCADVSVLLLMNREEILNKAKQERAARTAAKQQQKAATVVQAAWRSQAVRSSCTADLLQEWQSSYAAAAAQPDMVLPGPELSQAVRLALQATLPLGSSRSRQLLATGQPLPLIHSCIKGTIALVLRSMSSTQQQDRYTAAGLDADRQVRGAGPVSCSMMHCVSGVGGQPCRGL